MKCDILLIKYKWDFIGFLIRQATESNYNHCAIIIDTNHIAEAKATGIKKNRIDKYSNKFLYKTKLLRINGLTEEEKEKIIYCAEAQMGDKYSYLIYLYNAYLNWRGKATAFINCCSFVSLCFSVVNKNFRGDMNIIKTTPQNILDYVKGYNLVAKDGVESGNSDKGQWKEHITKKYIKEDY